MANQKIRTDIEVNSDSATADIKKLGKAADNASVDVEALAKELKQAERPVKDFGDTADRTSKDTESAFDRTGESAFGASSAIGEAFGGQGDAVSAIGSFGEVIEEFAGSFGAIGIAAGIAGSALVAGLQSVFEKSKQRAEELKQAASDMFDALVEGGGRLDDAYKDDALKKFIDTNLDLAKQMETSLPGSLRLVREALGGNKAAHEELIDQIDKQLDKTDELVQAGVPLTGAMGDERDALIKVKKQLEDTDGAYQIAIDSNDLLAGATKNAEGGYDGLGGSVERTADIMRRNQATIDRAAAAVAARGSTPEGNASYIEGKGWVYNTGPNRGQPVKRAAGGPVSAGMPYTVGEYGRETFVPSTNGTIVPNGAGVGGSVSIVQTIVTNDPMRVASQTAEALRRAQFRGG